MHGGGGPAPTGGKGKKRGLKQTKVEIIPMIDTMFFLLVFFILSSVGIVKLQGINVNLPNAAPSSAPAVKPENTPNLIVAISPSRDIFVNNIKVRPGQNIGPVLVNEVENKPEFGRGYDMKKASVVISADMKTPHGIVVRCIDEARQVNVVKFAIATAPEGTDAAAAAADALATGTPTR